MTHNCLPVLLLPTAAGVSRADWRHWGLLFAWLCIINISYINIISIARPYFYQTFLVDMTRLQTVWFLLVRSELCFEGIESIFPFHFYGNS